MAVAPAKELAERCGLATDVSLNSIGVPVLNTEEDEALADSFTDVSLVLGDSDQGSGTLFVTNRQVVWVGGAAMPLTSYAVRFTDIMMHAVASASDDFARPSIYMQLEDAQAPDDEDGDAGGAGPEVRLVPVDANTTANPDPAAEDDEGDFYYDEDEVAAGAAAANGGGTDEHAELADRLDAMLHVPERFKTPEAEGQFSDAEEDRDGATPDCGCCRNR